MFEGYLRIGGVEVINSERARGYLETSDCPRMIIDSPECESLQDAMGDEPYVHEEIRLAPWYDGSLLDLSSRFYGVVGHSLAKLNDSTRGASLTEGVTDGGVIGRTRKGMRGFRARATIIAQGTDALDYGENWLNSVFDGTCSQHGDVCGVMDAEFLTACPPERGEIPEFSAWVEANRNVFTNPSVESTAGTMNLHTNMIKDPDLQNLAVWSGTAGPAVLASNNRFQFNGIVGGSVRLGVSQTLDAKKPAGSYLLSAEMQTSEPAITGVRVILLDTTGTIIRATRDLPLVAGGGVNRYDFTLTPTDQWDRVYIEFTGVAIPQTAVAFLGRPILGQRTVVVPFFSGTTPQKVARNIGVNPNAATAGLGWSSNDGGPYPLTRNVAPPIPHPLGIATSAMQRNSGTLTTGVLASIYNADGLGNTGTPQRSAGVWVLVNEPGYRMGGANWQTDEELPANQWTYVKTVTPFAAGTFLTIYVQKIVGNAPTTARVYLTGLTVAEGATPPAKSFDGSYSQQQSMLPAWEGTANISPSYLRNADLTTAWLGTVNASESQLRGDRASGQNTATSNALVYQSTEWAASGVKSIKVDPVGGTPSAYGSLTLTGLTIGQLYTAIAKIRLDKPQTGSFHSTWVRQIMAQSADMPTMLSNRAPNEAGVHEVRVQFTPVSSTSVTLFMMNGSSETAIWFDDFAIVPGDYDGGYFDGSTADTDFIQHSWLGADNGSISTLETRVQVWRPRTDTEYAELVDPLRRYLHDAAVVSGPIEVESFRIGNTEMYGKTLEWTISSERAWIYGKMKQLDLTPALPTIVQDTPFNLVPYPSAELVKGLNPNPSLDVNAAGYSYSISANSGSNPSAFFSAARSAIGSHDVGYSYRGLLQGLATGTFVTGIAKAILASEIDMTAVAVGDSVLASTWGRFGDASGELVDTHMLQGYATWKTAANVAVGAPVNLGMVDTEPALSTWKLYSATTAKPATATKLVIELQYTFMWNSGGPVATYGQPTSLAMHMDETDAAPIVVVARNLSTNPGVEVNATDWVSSSATVSGTAPTAFVTSGRSTDIGAGGSAASFRTRLLGNNGTTAVAAAVSTLTNHQDVAIPAGSNRRVSLTSWAAALILAGSAPGTLINSLQLTYEFFNGGASLGAAVAFGTAAPADYSGKAYSLTGLAVPATATLVRIRATANVTWSSSATSGVNSDIRLYSDALAVSIP